MPQDVRVPILLLPMSLGIGGAETHVVSLATHLKARGWSVHVASGGGALVRHLEESQIEHVATPLDSRSPIKMLDAYRTVMGLCRDRKIGLVHAHARIPAYIAARICQKLDIPMVTTYHGTFVSGPFWNFVTRPGDRTIAVSTDVRDYVIREFSFDPGRVTVIPNGIDLGTFRPPTPQDRELARTRLSVPDWASTVILYESRLDIELTPVAQAAVDAALLLSDNYPDLHLLVAGDGEGMEPVRDGANRANRAAGRKIVSCTGYLTETFPAYAASDLVIGMSRVALEAMASERPVIIAGPGGIFGPARPETGDLLEERNYTSRNAPHPLSPERLAQEIRSLLSDPGLCRRLGSSGRETVAARHSMDLVTRETERIYLDALGG